MRLGLERILDDHIHLIRGSRVGLIVHPASINSRYQHAADLFYNRSDIHLTALFGPQHGIRGETQDNMIEWQGFIDRRTQLPVYSLYCETRRPLPDWLTDLDVLVFDVQDVGTRVYTFIYTMALAMQACAAEGKRFIVLDRPNPIGGDAVEGNILDPNYASFVGLYPIPMRHGMTVAELALMFNSEFSIGCELNVVPMQGWSRNQWWDSTGLPWVMPSPNMPTLDTATVYPGAVIFEGTEVSEGRGTTRPFELIGAPYIDPYELTEALNDLNLPGVYLRPAYFQPTFHKYCGQLCGGLQIHVTDRRAFKPYLCALAILQNIYQLYQEKFRWKQPPYEYVEDKLPIDVICGTDAIRQGIETGVELRQLEESWLAELHEFVEKRQKYLLY
ncbi:MAG: DUF1343 domain-containing protein [Acidobacteriota bacterium]|nr:DUF1343 domain-containing protein [Blastocatellia bacterium]MDW8412671.1 DUF1343 domain-containing protein [Acidobacteriota bacterium]